MVVEGGVLLRVEHLEQGGRRVAPEVHRHLVDLVEQEQRIAHADPAEVLHDLAGHRADVGPAVAANLGLVAHTAERHADELAVRRPGNALTERGLAHTRRPDQAQDRSALLLDALLDREIFDDPLLDLGQTVMIGFEYVLGVLQVAVDLGPLLPGRAQQPVDVVANDRRLGRHRRHQLELVELGLGLFASLLGHAGGLDLALELGDLVVAVVDLSELLLNGLHLLIQVVLALALLHLLLDAAADALFDLQHVDLALDQPEHVLEPGAQVDDLQHLLLFAELQRHVGRCRVREAAGLLDARQRRQDLRRHLLIELHVGFELGQDRADQNLDLPLVVLRAVLEHLDPGGEIVVVVDLRQPHALVTLDEHLHGAVRQLQ